MLDVVPRPRIPSSPSTGGNRRSQPNCNEACAGHFARSATVLSRSCLSPMTAAHFVAMSGSGDILIVEIKSCLLDYRTDAKWQDYLEYCDRLYFAVRADFPCEVIPEEAGLILADRYGAELVREGIEERLSAARRRAMMLAFARAAALRLQQHLDPGCSFEI